MRALILCSLILICFSVTNQTAFSQQIFINEFLASNSGALTDEAGEFDDWVELYNPGPDPVNIAGMYVTDDLNQPTQWRIPDTAPAQTTIAPGGFLLLWFDKQMSQGPLHVNAKLSADGEDIAIFAADGLTLIDGLAFGPQTANISYGRVPDGGADFQFFTQPTPNAPNDPSTGGFFTEKPIASVESGFFNFSFQVELSTATAGAEIRYTLDGSVPTGLSQVYSAPLPISQTTTLRARAFAANMLPGSTMTNTYLFDTPHTFPVVAISFDEADFFDSLTGIYPNYLEEWERPVQVELFEDNGKPVMEQEAVAKIHGTGSAQFAQKSLRFKAKADGGSGSFKYPIFPDMEYEEYKTFILRNSGQDWNTTMFRDAFASSLVDDLSDVGAMIEKPRLHLQGFRPSVAYLNGKYWGIYNMREHMSKTYIEQHFGLKDSEIDLLDNDNDAKAGDYDRWNFFTQYLSANHFKDDDQLQELAKFLDLPHFLDYNLFNIIIDNSDWPGNNYRRWRERKNDARWQFLTFDLDLSFGLLVHEENGLGWNTGDASANSLARALDSTAVLWPNPYWTTLPLRRAMENPSFRRDFINRAADFLNVLFKEERVSQRVDEFVELYQPEMQRHFDRWQQGWNPWAANLQILRKFLNERPQYVRQQLTDYFDEITGTANVIIEINPPQAGRISFSTIQLDGSHSPWEGEYFTGVDIPVKAEPMPGYVFVGWSDDALGDAPSGAVNFSGDEKLVAYFLPGSSSEDPIVINEINYNSSSSMNSGDWVELFNPNDHGVDISGWTFEDEGSFFVMPGGTVMPAGSFLVLVEDAVKFSSIYPNTVNVLGDFGEGDRGFKLSNSNELIQLKNAALVVIDSVHYRDKAPWPKEADGTGSTLQLIRWELDNALPESWKADIPTPGLPNVAPQQSQTIDFPAIGNKFTNSPPFTITATASSGLPVNFFVVSGPATLDGDMVTVYGSEGIVTIGVQQQGNNNWLPAPVVYQSFRVIKPAVHCSVIAEMPWWEWIERVEFGDIDHLSFKTQIGNFTSISTMAPIGESLQLTVTPAFSWEVFDEYFRVWIDFDQDGYFDGPDELVLEAIGRSAVSADVFIPYNAVPGPTLMRVAMQRDKFPEPCEDIIYGEAQDYTVILSNSSDWMSDNHTGLEKTTLKFLPNPARSTLNVRFSTGYDGLVGMTVAGGGGVNLFNERFNLQAGEHYIELDISSLPSGTYQLLMQRPKQKPIAGIFVKME